MRWEQRLTGPTSDALRGESHLESGADANAHDVIIVVDIESISSSGRHITRNIPFRTFQSAGFIATART